MKLKSIFTTCAVSALLFLSCSNSDEPNGGDIEIPELETIEFTTAEADVNNALNDFSFRFFKTSVNLAEKLNFEDGNVTVSPISAAMALSMLANTVDEESKDVFLDGLGYGNVEELNNTYNKILRYLPSKSNGCEIHMANSAWCHYVLSPTEEWKQCLETYFYAPVSSIDLHTEAGIDIINAWCSRNTNGKIPTILDEVDSSSLFYLLNAMYFNGEWEYKFDKDKTLLETFNGRDGQAQVYMMHRSIQTTYFQGLDYEGIILPFNGNTRMTLILPEENADANEIVKSLSYLDYENLAGSGETAVVTLALPKFETATEIMLNQIIEEMGINMTFNGVKIGWDKNINAGAKQKTKVSIDEEGAEAAAVTIIGAYTSTGNISQPKITLTFDRPFIYFIENSKTSSILMAGIVNNI